MAHYVLPNYRNKAAMVKGFKEGMRIKCFSLDPETTRDGIAKIIGPNYPEIQQWEAEVRVVDGEIVEVL